MIGLDMRVCRDCFEVACAPLFTPEPEEYLGLGLVRNAFVLVMGIVGGLMVLHYLIRSFNLL